MVGGEKEAYFFYLLGLRITKVFGVNNFLDENYPFWIWALEFPGDFFGWFVIDGFDLNAKINLHSRYSLLTVWLGYWNTLDDLQKVENRFYAIYSMLFLCDLYWYLFNSSMCEEWNTLHAQMRNFQQLKGMSYAIYEHCRHKLLSILR